MTFVESKRGIKSDRKTERESEEAGACEHTGRMKKRNLNFDLYGGKWRNREKERGGKERSEGNEKTTVARRGKSLSDNICGEKEEAGG